MMLASLLRDETGAAASEFVLALPMMLPLIFIAMEAGNFFWSQQKLVESVRNGARYAARQNYEDLCPPNSAGTGFDPAKSSTVTAIKNLTRTGDVAGTGVPKLPNWTNSQVTVQVNCDSFVATGIYDALKGEKGAIVTVSAPKVPYRSILGALGVIDSTYSLAAETNAPVIGV